MKENLEIPISILNKNDYGPWLFNIPYKINNFVKKIFKNEHLITTEFELFEINKSEENDSYENIPTANLSNENKEHLFSVTGDMQGFLRLLNIEAPVNSVCSWKKISTAYRRQALHVHTDKGGKREDWDLLQNAYSALELLVEKNEYTTLELFTKLEEHLEVLKKYVTEAKVMYSDIENRYDRVQKRGAKNKDELKKLRKKVSELLHKKKAKNNSQQEHEVQELSNNESETKNETNLHNNRFGLYQNNNEVINELQTEDEPTQINLNI